MNVVDFSFTCVGRKVTFQNISDEIPGAQYSWNFGDGTTSEEENPTHEYSRSGIFRVSLELLHEQSNVVSSIGRHEETILVSEFVKTHLSSSIYRLIDTYIPREIFGVVPARVKKQLIEKWQLYLQPLVNHDIPIEEFNNELYYEALENQLIIELAAYDYMILQVNLAIQSGINVVKENNSQEETNIGCSRSSSSESNVNGQTGKIKKIQTGPTEVEYFDSSDESDTMDNAIKALKPGGIIDITKQNLCMLASRLDIYLPICNRLSADVVVPKVVNRRNPGFLGGPDPIEVIK